MSVRRSTFSPPLVCSMGMNNHSPSSLGISPSHGKIMAVLCFPPPPCPLHPASSSLQCQWSLLKMPPRPEAAGNDSPLPLQPPRLSKKVVIPYWPDCFSQGILGWTSDLPGSCGKSICTGISEPVAFSIQPKFPSNSACMINGIRNKKGDRLLKLMPSSGSVTVI